MIPRRCKVSMKLLLFAWVLLLGACGPTNLLEPMSGSLTLLESESRLLLLRYADPGGSPIEGATCEFSIEGQANGATVEPREAISDAEGYCRTELRVQFAATFKVVVVSQGAEESIDVTVSDEPGGVIEALVADTVRVPASSAEVLLLEYFRCADLDSQNPPAPVTLTANPHQVVVMRPGRATELKIFGLKAGQHYTVVAIGRAKDRTVSVACEDNIVLIDKQIELGKAYSLTLDLQDVFVNVPGDSLKVITRFHGDLGLQGVAALLKKMSEGPNGLVDYLLRQMAANEDDFVAELVEAHRSELVAAMSRGTTQGKDREAMLRVASAFASMANIELHTIMKAIDEDIKAASDGDALTMHHRFPYFTAELLGEQTRIIVDPRRAIFDSNPTPQLEDWAKLTVENGETAHISQHRLVIPLADALVGHVLMHEFGDFRIERIITSMLDCTGAGQLVAGELADSHKLDRTFIDPGKGTLVDDTCQGVVGQMSEDIRQQIKVDLKDYPSDQRLTFRGQAPVKLMPDKAKIGRLFDGHWTDLGSFNARRQ